jgi:LysR family transcriptional regulator, hydrogen peroxide-inducible genes activator
VFDELGVDCDTVYRSDRDDWVLAMIASGFGFGFFPKYSISNATVVVRPLVNPEFWREVSLTTVKGLPYSRAVGALVHDAMRSAWLDHEALAVAAISEGTLSVVPVMNSIVTMPQKVAGNARITTKGSPKFW